MLLRWIVTVWLVKLYFGRVNDTYFFAFTLAIPLYFLLKIKQIYLTILAGVRSAMDGFNAFRLFLWGIPEYNIW